MRSVADEYLETQVMTASPERLHLVVVETAIRFGRTAAEALDKRDFETAFHALNRSRACVNELLTCINCDPNPELGQQLKGLFLFVHRNLVRGDLLHDPQMIRDGLQILETHRETWLELMDRLQEEKTHLAGPHTAVQTESSWTT